MPSYDDWVTFSDQQSLNLAEFLLKSDVAEYCHPVPTHHEPTALGISVSVITMDSP